MTPHITVPLSTVCHDPHLDLRPAPATMRPGALDRPVRWAHVSELPDPAPYLLGGELLLTAGVTPPADTGDYVRRLLDAGITALGFGLTPPLHDEVPAALLEACAEHALPLLTVPTGTPFLAISRAVALALDRTRHREQHRLTQAREHLTRAATSGLETLTAALATELGAWTALLDSGDEPIAAQRMPRPLPPEIRELLRKLRQGSGIRTATTELPGGEHVLAQPAIPHTGTSPMLAVGRREPFGGTDRSITAAGAALLGLTARTGAITEALSGSTTRLLLGHTEPGEALHAILGPGPYRVVAATAHHRRSGAPADPDRLRAQLRTPLLDLAGEQRFTAVTADEPGTAELDDLLSAGWLTAVSAPAGPQHLAAAAHELPALLQRARATGKPIIAGTAPSLTDLVPADAAAAFAERLLEPLVELDRRRDTDLLGTLRTWLAHHGGWEPTAAALGVHRNSVRHRIAQVEQAIGCDLSDAETRVDLWFGLRHHAGGRQ